MFAISKIIEGESRYAWMKNVCTVKGFGLWMISRKKTSASTDGLKVLMPFLNPIQLMVPRPTTESTTERGIDHHDRFAVSHGYPAKNRYRSN
jgi:hypothetical protein